MRIPPIPPAQATSASSWVTLRLALVAVVAVLAGAMPDLWPYLRVTAATAPIDVPENAIYKVEQAQYAPVNMAAYVAEPAGTQTVVRPVQFAIPFYGTTYTQVLISDDGYIAFDPASGTRRVDMLPAPASSPLQRALLAFHAELHSTVKHAVVGTAPNRALIVDWSNARYVYGAANASPMSFQAQLFENGAPPVVMYTSTYGPPTDTRTGTLPLNGTAKLVTGVDAGDVFNDGSGAVRKNYTLWFSANAGQPASLSSYAVAYLETPGPTTTTTLALVPGTPLVGQSQQIRVDVTAGGLPVVGGGTVTLTKLLPGQALVTETAPVVDGSATFTTSFDIAAMHAFSAEYVSGPSPHYQPSASNILYTSPSFALLSAIDFSVDVSSETLPAPLVNTRMSTWTATVTAGGHPATDGSVRFTSGNVVRGTVPVVNGQAVLTQPLQDGTHTIKADYLPSNPLIIGSSITKTIDSGNATVLIEPFVLDNQWLVASVTASGNVTGGSVSFAVDGVPVGDAPVVRLSNGTYVAVVAAPPMPFPLGTDGFVSPGVTYTVDASYTGSPGAPPGQVSKSVTITRIPTNGPLQSATTFSPPVVHISSTSLGVSTTAGQMTMTATVGGTNVAGGRVLFFLDGKPVALGTVSGATAVVTVPVSPGAHTMRAAFLGRYVNGSTYVKPSSGTATVGSFTKVVTTTSYSLELGTRLGLPLWTVRASVTGGNVTSGTVTVSSSSINAVSAPVVNGEALITFTTPAPAANNHVLIAGLVATYSGNDVFAGSASVSSTVRSYPTITTAVPLNASGGLTNPDYTTFDATVKMATFENIFDAGGGGGSMQVRDGQGGALLSDTLIDFVGQTTQRVTTSHAVPLTLIAYAGQLTQLAPNSYRAILPSGVFLQHPQAQSRMTQSKDETPYEWIHLSDPVQVSRCDDCFTTLSARSDSSSQIPWPVRFLNSEFQQLYLNNNGLISFTQGITQWNGQCPPVLPTAGPLLAGFWADHDMRTGGLGPKVSGTSSWDIVGQAPHRIAVFQWDSVNFYNTRSDYAGTAPGVDDQAAFQIHLYEDNRPPRVALRNGPPTKGDLSNIFPVIGVDYGDMVRADLLQCTNSGPAVKHFINEAYQFQLVLTNAKITIEPSQSPAFSNQPLTLTTRVDVGGLPAFGNVTFTRTSYNLGNASPGATVTLTGVPGADGEVVYSDTPAVPLGSHTYTLNFAANPGEPYGNASASLVVPVEFGPRSRIALANEPLVPVYGEQVTLRAAVTDIASGNPATGGLVTFKAGTTVLGTAALNTSSGMASITVRAPNGGLVPITGQYQGAVGFEASATIGMSVQPRPVVVQPEPVVVVYGAPTPAIGFEARSVPGNNQSGIAPGDTAASLIGVTTASNRTVTSPVGTYVTTAAVPVQANYQVSTLPGTLRVDQAGLTAIGPQLSMTFGAPVPPLAPITYFGFANNESAASITPPVTATIATSTSPVGSYPISLSGGSADNYVFGYVPGALNVTPRAVTVQADDQHMVYGGALPALTATYSGFVAGDSASSLDVPPTISTNASSASPVGNYPIIVVGGSDANYSLTRVNGTLGIGRAALQVTANSQTIPYGASPAPFSSTFSGFANGDTEASLDTPVRYNSSVSAMSPVGSYPVWPFNASDANYTVSFVGGNVSVTAVALNVTADSKTRDYGDTNPPLTGSVTGVQGSDVISANYSTSATVASPVGTYPITATLIDPANRAGNYNVSITHGTLNVKKRALTVTAPSLTRPYGQPNMPLNGSISGVAPGDTISVSFNTSADATSPIGAYPITATLSDPNNVLGNYDVTVNNGTLTVSAATLTATATNQVRGYGAPNPILTGTLSGVVAGDGISAKYTTDAVPSSAVGPYTITPTLLDPLGRLGNYTVQLVNGALNVSPATLTVAVADAGRKYGVANPPFTGTITGIQNGDNITASYFSNTSPSTPIGDYPILAHLQDPGSRLGNYSLSITNGNLRITQAPLTVVGDDSTRSYGAANPPFTGTITGVQNGDPITASFTSNTTPQTPVGSWPINAVLSDPSGKLSNYDVQIEPGKLAITAAALTITAENKTKVYGAAMPLLTLRYDGFVNGETVASLASPATVTTTATATSPVGSHPIVASGAASSNYAIAYVDGLFKVTPAVLTITADDKAMTYGGALPAFTASYDGFVNGDTFASLATPVVLTSTATAASSAGSYAITAAGATSSNYDIAFEAGTLTVSRAALTITADDKTKVYGAAVPELTASYVGFVNGDTAASLDTAVSLNTSAAQASAVGTYPISVGGASDANYTIAFINGDLTVTRAALTIAAEPKAKVYGAPLPVLTATYTGFVNGDDAGDLDTPLSLSTSATAASSAGSYPITAGGAADHNYAITFTDSSLTISRAALTITADDKLKTYGAAVPALTASYSGFVNGDDAADLATPVLLATTGAQASAVGEYAIDASAATSSNYDITFVNGTLRVNRATLTVTADDKTKVYGAAMPALTSTYAGFVNGDSAATLDTQVVLTTTATANSAVGAYPITASAAADHNYDIVFVGGTLDVSRAALTITADDKSKTYGAAMPALTASYAGFVNGDDASSLATPVSLATAATASSSAGTFAITAAAATSPNYTISFVPGTLTINRAALTITADSKSKVYGASMPALTATYEGFVNGDDEWSLDTAVTLSTPVTASSAVGSYAITATGAVDANYTITLVNGAFVVTPAALTITADNATKTYGAAPPSLTVSYDGFVNGDDAADLATATSVETDATAASAVGQYPITVGGATSANYAITFVPGTLTVNRASLTITADLKSKVYGAAMPALTASYSGFVNGDTAANLDSPVSLTTAATAASAVGTYPISPSAAADHNYDITFVDSAIDVTAAALTVRAEDKSKTYGAAMPALTASYSGFVNGDDESDLATAVSLVTPADAASPVGSYAIVASAAASPNYAITFADGTLTVDRAALTITADAKTKVYGEAMPALTATYSGFVNGDGVGALDTPVSLATAATASSIVGSYAVTAADAADANYDISFVNGAVEVTRAPLTVTARDASKVYGAALPEFGVSYAGFVNGDDVGALDAPVTFSTPATAASNTGTYAIVPGGALDHNYAITFVNGTLTVDRAALTVTPNAATKFYGATLPAFAASYEGFVNGDGAASLDVAPAFSTAATASSSVGTYTITASGASDANYTISFGTGTLTVEKAPLTVTADDKSKLHGQQNPALTATYNGFVLGQGPSALSGTLVLTTTATQTSLPGTYPISAAGVTSANYAITFVAGTLTVDEADTPGQMQGNGYIRDDNAKYSFNFSAREWEEKWWEQRWGQPDPGNTNERARFSLRIDEEGRKWKKGNKKRDDRFETRTVEFISFSDDPTVRPGRPRRPQIDTVLFGGTGEWNGARNYRYEVYAQDAGEPGRHRESITVKIWSPAGQLVAEFSGELDGGNIQSSRIHR